MVASSPFWKEVRVLTKIDLSEIQKTHLRKSVEVRQEI
jgi:hypothetical protein